MARELEKAAADQPVAERLLTIGAVTAMIPFSRVHIMRLANREPPEFPRPIKLGDRRIAFRESEITAWINGHGRAWKKEVA